MMQFDEPMNDDTRKMIEEMFPGAPLDERTALINFNNGIDGRQMKAISNTARQPVKVSLVGEGEVKTLSDGTQYQVTNKGWIKLEQDRDL